MRKNRAHGSNGKDGWIGEALDLPARAASAKAGSQPLEIEVLAVSSLKHDIFIAVTGDP